MLRFITVTISTILAIQAAGVPKHDLLPVTTITAYNFRETPTRLQQTLNDFAANIYYPSLSDVCNSRTLLNTLALRDVIKSDVLPSTDILLKDVFYSPIFIATKSTSNPDRMDIYFAEKGMRSVFNEPYFSSVKTFLLSRTDKSAVAFQPRNFFNFKIFNCKVNDIVVPEDYTVGDFVKTLSDVNRIPVFAIFEKFDFDDFHFENIYDFGKFAVYDTYIEPVQESGISDFLRN